MKETRFAKNDIFGVNEKNSFIILHPGNCSGQPIPSPAWFPSPGIKLASPALQADSLPAEPQGKPSMAAMGLKKGEAAERKERW